jgi:hypothetical protein
VTLTPALQAARERLRRKGIEATVGELALAGAQQMLEAAAANETEEVRRRELRAELISAVLAGETMDANALDEVRESWTHA